VTEHQAHPVLLAIHAAVADLAEQQKLIRFDLHGRSNGYRTRKVQTQSAARHIEDNTRNGFECLAQDRYTKRLRRDEPRLLASFHLWLIGLLSKSLSLPETQCNAAPGTIKTPMRVALAQINPTVGDFHGNVNLMAAAARQAADRGAVAVVFPELSLAGYPPRDLVEKPSFLSRCEDELAHLAKATADLDLTLVCGYVGRSDHPIGKRAMNSAAVIERGQIVFRQHKTLLPTYDVFDEARYFHPADRVLLYTLRGRPVALTICEDAWNDRNYWQRRLYQRDPVEELFGQGARALICINASPYHMGKRDIRRRVYSSVARRYGQPVVYVNQVGGNDQLVFDGSSFAMNGAGEVIAAASSFSEDLVIADLDAGSGENHETCSDECEAVYHALVLGTRDYIRKCGFSRVLIGLSGGIDSSLTAAIAVEAVGKENVTGLALPGPFSSDHSLRDAREMAERLDIRFEIVPITGAYDRVLEELTPVFAGRKPDVTEENIQSRLRGLTLMAMSNKTGALVLTTGNKSEIAVGYCTLYGDMCGGLAVISDVPKTMVYTLSRIANQRLNHAIPESVFTKPPSAELRPDQKDTDSLPEYDVLDKILEAYIELYRSPKQIASSLNLPIELVQDIVNKVDRAEYKRQQAAPGLKVTSKAFGIGRRFPIAQRFSE
jgi:NAD+ synthase (glutamine-hydrolysing)